MPLQVFFIDLLSNRVFASFGREVPVYNGGGAGIRTLGTGYPAQRFSRPPRSTTLAPLREINFQYYLV
jgi:hypothetical protein